MSNSPLKHAVEVSNFSQADVSVAPEPLRNDTPPQARDATGGQSEDYAVAPRNNHEDNVRPQIDFPFDENVFDSTPRQPENESEEVAYIQPDADELVHPPDFKPFFTLIEDPESGAYHHPLVHYIFSDDDPEILTTAVLDTFDEAREDEPDPQRPIGSPPQRSVIVDVAADGKTVTSAASLSPQWQGLETSVGPAPSWGNDPNSAERGLMLRISGQRSIAVYDSDEPIRHQRQYQSVEEMLEAFSRQLARLDSTLDGTQ